MSRLGKLKCLKDEIGRLFHEGFDEIAVIDRLRTGKQFADANPEQMQAFYSNLQEKRNLEAEYERQITDCKQRILEHEQQIEQYPQQIEQYKQQSAEYKQQVMDIEKAVVEEFICYCNISNAEWKIEEHERLLAREQQIKTQLGFMIKYQQNASKFLIYDEFFVGQVVRNKFWQERFLITAKNSNATGGVYIIKIQDLFQVVTKSFTIQKVDDRLCGIYALKFPFALIHESDYYNDINYFRLTKFDFESESLQIVQSFEFNARCQVLVSASDTSKFLLRKGNDVNECELAGGKIRIGKKLTLDSNFDVGCGSYFDEQFCSLQFESSWDNPFRNGQLTQVKMLIHDLERNEHSTQDIDSTPETLSCFDEDKPKSSTWIRDSIFVSVEFRLARKWGVIFTSPQVRNWKCIEFASDLRIEHIQAFVDGTLMVCSESEEQRKRKIYKLQMRKPDSLRNMAWIAMVKLFKEAKIEHPYEEARQYLPLNSDIQPFVFTED